MSAWIQNNSVIVGQDVQDSKLWKETFIKSARSSIEISGSYCGGKIFRQYLSLIDGRLQDHKTLKVHIIASKYLLESADQEKISALKKTYSERFEVLITTAKGIIKRSENHVKILVVDNQYFVVGGTGMQDNLLSSDTQFQSTTLFGKVMASKFVDTDIVGCGPMAKSLRVHYFQLFKVLEMSKFNQVTKNRFFSVEIENPHCDAFDKSEDKIENVALKMLTSSPEQPKNSITGEISDFVRGAQAEINIGNLSFELVEELSKSFEQRTSSVPVTLITNSPSADKVFTRYYGNLALPYLKYVNNIHFFNKSNVFYHRKIITIDGKYSLIGSYNFTMKSAKQDYEIALVIKDFTVTKIFNKILENDKKETISYTNTNQSTPWWYKMLNNTI